MLFVWVLVIVYFISKKPIIYDLGSSKVIDYNFQTALVYRYAINGKESVVFLATDEDLKTYKEYLSIIGSWYVK